MEGMFQNAYAFNQDINYSSVTGSWMEYKCCNNYGEYV